MKSFTKSILLLGFLLGFIYDPTHAAATSSNSDWEMFQGNPQHTGYFPGSVNINQLKLRWSIFLFNPSRHSSNHMVNYPAFPLFNIPIIASNTVFIDPGVYDSPGQQSLLALDTNSGKIIWSAPLNVNDDFAGFLTGAAYDNGQVFVQTTGSQNSIMFSALNAYDAKTGTLQSSTPFNSQGNFSLTVTPYQGTIYMNGGYGGGAYGISEAGIQQWFTQLPQYDMWTPAVNDNYVVAYTADVTNTLGQLEVLQRSTGAILFTIQDPQFFWTGYSDNAAPVLDNDHQLAIMTESGYPFSPGHLTVFDLSNKSAKYSLSNLPLAGHTGGYIGQPALAKGVLYVPIEKQLVAIDEMKGQVLWRWNLPQNDSFSDVQNYVVAPIVTDNVVFISGEQGTYAIDLKTHETVWQFNAGGYLAMSENTLIIAGLNSTVYAFEMKAL